MVKQNPARPFSVELEAWLKSNRPKTLRSVIEAFGKRSFAIAFLLLMFIPALPLPTGGITHVTEIITMLLCLELIAGLRNIWLPQKWQDFRLGAAVEKKALPFIIRRVRWFERFSRPRLGGLINHTLFLRLIGLIVLIFALGAFLAPPFSGLDTLPSLGVIIISLGLILEDAVLIIAGTAVGALGLGTIIGLSTIIVQLVHKIF